MSSTPAARVLDKVAHPLPGTMLPGPGSFNVHVGMLPAWRGLPAAMAAVLQAAKQIADTAVNVAKAASTAASGTPAAPAAKAAEEALKAATLAAMSSAMTAMKIPTPSGGIPDTHICAVPAGLVPHGPGMVIDGNPTILINGLPGAQVGDTFIEPLGPPDKIIMGCNKVIYGPQGAGGGGGMGAILSGLLNMIKGVLKNVAAKVMEMASELAQQAVRAAAKVAAFVVGLVQGLVQEVMSAIAAVYDTTKGAVKSVVAGVKQLAQDVSDYMNTRVRGMKPAEADAAIVQAQKDAVAALDKRIKDLDKWDAETQKSFERWFGSKDKADRDEIRKRMVDTRDHLNGFTLDNYEANDDAYAYVYGDDDQTMYLGEGFADAPATGRDSRAGTLVHEASHYDSISGTDDHAYGEDDAEDLAHHHHGDAMDNADSFEYFVEDGM